MRAKRAWRWLGFLAGPVVLIVLAIYFFLISPPSSSPPERVVIATLIQPSSGLIIVAAENGFFQDNGLDAVYQTHSLGVHALQAVLNGKADIAVAADIPFMFAVMKGGDIAIFATIYKSRRDLALMTMSDRGIAAPKDLVGKTIGATFGTNLQFFLDAMLMANGIPEEKVTIVDLKPSELVNALQTGKADAVTVFPPYMEELQGIFGSRAVIFFGEDLYTSRYNLIAKRDYLKKHPDTARKVLMALREAEQYAKKNPPQAYEIIGRHLKLKAHDVAEMFESGAFELTLEQSLLLTLDEETRWAMKRGFVKMAPVPNYLDYLNVDPLLAADPEAVKIIH